MTENIILEYSRDFMNKGLNIDDLRGWAAQADLLADLWERMDAMKIPLPIRFAPVRLPDATQLLTLAEQQEQTSQGAAPTVVTGPVSFPVRRAGVPHSDTPRPSGPVSLCTGCDAPIPYTAQFCMGTFCPVTQNSEPIKPLGDHWSWLQSDGKDVKRS